MNPAARTPRGRRPGVTLLEILVAVAVLAVGLATVFQIFPMGFAASTKSASQTIAYELAAQKLEDIRNNFLFGGIPNGAAADRYLYYGNPDAPNPDGTTLRAVNTGTQYQPFSDTSVPEKFYFYRVETVPVIDPMQKYLEYPYQITTIKKAGFASMWRVTVTVRGPLKTQAEAQDVAYNAGVARKGTVQVKLATYIANKNQGFAQLATVAYGRHRLSTGVYQEDADANKLNIVGIGSDTYPYPENFTCFSRGALAALELGDTGPTILTRSTPEANSVPNDYSFRLNKLGLDNIVIYTLKTAGSASVADRYIAETNKVVAIYSPDDSGTGYWQLILQNKIYGRDNDFPLRTASPYGSTKIIDSTYDGEALLGTPKSGFTESYGYPVGTKVRTHMNLQLRTSL